MSVGRGVVAALVTVAALGSLAGLSGVAYAPETPSRALLRMSWRSRGQHVRTCRQPTPEEQASLPAHMRPAEICEGRIVPFRLKIQVDGAPMEDAPVHAAGAREDRPIYVFREIWLEPGRHRLAVRFHPMPGPAVDTTAGALALDTTFAVPEGQVRLVTRAEDGALQVR